MNLFFWKNNKKVDELAAKIAARIVKTLPAEKIDNRKGVRNNLRKFDREICNAIGELKKYNMTIKFSIYSRARFHRIFMEKLAAHGYDKELIKALNEKLLFCQL